MRQNTRRLRHEVAAVIKERSHRDAIADLDQKPTAGALCDLVLGTPHTFLRERSAAAVLIQAWWRGVAVRLALARLKSCGETPATLAALTAEVAVALARTAAEVERRRWQDGEATAAVLRLVRTREAVGEWHRRHGGGRRTCAQWHAAFVDPERGLWLPGVRFGACALLDALSSLMGRTIPARYQLSLSAGLLWEVAVYLRPPRGLLAVTKARVGWLSAPAPDKAQRTRARQPAPQVLPQCLKLVADARENRKPETAPGGIRGGRPRRACGPAAPVLAAPVPAAPVPAAPAGRRLVVPVGVMAASKDAPARVRHCLVHRSVVVGVCDGEGGWDYGGRKLPGISA